MSNFVLLKAYTHEYDAQMAVGLLKDSGIEVVLSVDDMGLRPYVTLNMGNNRVLVQEKDLQRAREAIKVLDEPSSEDKGRS